MKLSKATSQSDFFTLMRIRNEVFVHEQKVDPRIELDDDDKTCTHYILWSDDLQPMGCCRILVHNDAWHIGRIALDIAFRKQGGGSFLLQEMERIARFQKIHKLALGAQLQATPFYQKNGYLVCGEQYVDADIVHVPMEKTL